MKNLKNGWLTLITLVFSTNLIAGSNVINLPIIPIIPNKTSLSWQPATNLPVGARLAYLVGNPTKPEFYVALLKLPANYFVPVHQHIHYEYNTVLTGMYYLGKGNKVNMANTIALPVGSIIAFPPQADHYGFTKSETILEISGIGPWGTQPKKL